MKNMSRKYTNARDKAGRTLLHYAVQHSSAQRTADNISNQRSLNTSNNNPDSNGGIILSDINLTNNDPNTAISSSDTARLYNATKTNAGQKKDCSFRKRFCPRNANFTQDYLGIIKYLIQEFPAMLGQKNNVSLPFFFNL